MSNTRELNFLSDITLFTYRATLLCLNWIRRFIDEDNYVFVYLFIYQLPANFCRFASVPKDPSLSALLFSPEISVKK